jgi:hypothetical protein
MESATGGGALRLRSNGSRVLCARGVFGRCEGKRHRVIDGVRDKERGSKET